MTKQKQKLLGRTVTFSMTVKKLIIIALVLIAILIIAFAAPILIDKTHQNLTFNTLELPEGRGKEKGVTIGQDMGRLALIISLGEVSSSQFPSHKVESIKLNTFTKTITVTFNHWQTDVAVSKRTVVLADYIKLRKPLPKGTYKVKVIYNDRGGMIPQEGVYKTIETNLTIDPMVSDTFSREPVLLN